MRSRGACCDEAAVPLLRRALTVDGPADGDACRRRASDTPRSATPPPPPPTMAAANRGRRRGRCGCREAVDVHAPLVEGVGERSVRCGYVPALGVDVAGSEVRWEAADRHRLAACAAAGSDHPRVPVRAGAADCLGRRVCRRQRRVERGFTSAGAMALAESSSPKSGLSTFIQNVQFQPNWRSVAFQHPGMLPP